MSLYSPKTEVKVETSMLVDDSANAEGGSSCTEDD